MTPIYKITTKRAHRESVKVGPVKDIDAVVRDLMDQGASFEVETTPFHEQTHDEHDDAVPVQMVRNVGV